MFGKRYASSMIDRSAENAHDRRRFLRAAGLTGLGAVGAGAAFGLTASAGATEAPEGEISDAAVLNFALNLEYLEAEFYLHAVTGKGLADAMTTGVGVRGGVTGGRAVKFQTKAVRQFAQEIAGDEKAHVLFLRSALGSAAVSRPAIDLQASFTAAAQAAGLVKAGRAFDAFASEENFLLAAYLFEDVGVTAYKGAAPLITNKTYVEAAAGILAVEAYHAANIRTALFLRDGYPDLKQASVKISDARDSLDGATDLDQGVLDHYGNANIVPADPNGIAFSRSPGQVLNIVYLTDKAATSGGFFPKGVNGVVNASADSV
ncbi:ferritin-like domain-containing protein [Amycolatopsis sp. cg5]|uniref:ferritin-like domain-containing protein n=1 Tax=Amycolatopsis sp. cg5 TaxID=3238802 RepID=UPI003523EE26